MLLSLQDSVPHWLPFMGPIALVWFVRVSSNVTPNRVRVVARRRGNDVGA